MNGETRLSVVLAENPNILEYIIGLNPHDFARLRTPLLRKVMPPRITLRRLAAMLNIPLLELIENIQHHAGAQKTIDLKEEDSKPLPAVETNCPEWLNQFDRELIKWVDVTEIDDVFGDPMPPINVAVNTSKPGEIIGVRHRWQPQPLFDIWHARGLKFWTEQISPELWQIYIYRPAKGNPTS